MPTHSPRPARRPIRRAAPPLPAVPAVPPASAALADVLEAADLTAAALAGELGVPVRTFNSWRYGTRTMPEPMRARLAVVLLRRAEELQRRAAAFAAAAARAAEGAAPG